jgi:hypothetical protein
VGVVLFGKARSAWAAFEVGAQALRSSIKATRKVRILSVFIYFLTMETLRVLQKSLGLNFKSIPMGLLF